MKGSQIADKITNLINERAKMQVWQDCNLPEFKKTEQAIIDLLTENEDETVAYIKGWCVGINLTFILEVADEINSKLHSKRFIDALRYAAKEDYRLNLESIDMAEKDSKD